MQFSQIFVATNEHIPVFVGSRTSVDVDRVLATVCGRTIILLVMAESLTRARRRGGGDRQFAKANLRVHKFQFQPAL
jgi:hypothetical protein